MADRPPTHWIKDKDDEYDEADGKVYVITYCGLRFPKPLTSEDATGMVLPDICPDCQKAKETADNSNAD